MNKMFIMLEFNKITDLLKEHCLTEKARERFHKLEPLLKEKELRNKLRETTEARNLLDMQGAPPLGTIADIRPIVDAADKGELLSVDELGKISSFAVLCMRVIRYLNKNPEWESSIAAFGKGMAELDTLREEIDSRIRNGRIDDYATRELKDIRKKMELTTNAIRLKLENILKGKREYFSESFISNRNGHYTLPVKKEYKSKIKGSVIAASSSGATCFIEPEAAAKLREEWEVLLMEENNEERKILYTLTGCVSDYKNEIIMNSEYLEELDYIFAKAKLSADMQGVEPLINTERRLTILDGRHPLIKKEDCVPLNVAFGENIRGIVITGPNTGGKTVALKTVGLYSLMAQCGLHVPCKEADLCMNTQVLCDIGDGQSISENLSTFSSHVKNIIEIVKLIERDSLVLLDELGSGTDPAEGMGIAIAVLEELKKSCCNFIVTTHYPEVKDYAKGAEGICNARMAFDKESLKPLYRMEMGKAGESCAFYIARKLGMPDTMLKQAYRFAYSSVNADPQKETSNEKRMDKYKQERNRHKNTIIKAEDKEQKNNTVEEKFQVGDSVIVHPQNKLGIVFQKVNSKGEAGVQIRGEKILVNHKRLELKASAKVLYPDNYDFSILFDSIENRKSRHLMERKYVPGLEIKLKEDKE